MRLSARNVGCRNRYTGYQFGGGIETSFYLLDGDKHDWEIETESVSALSKDPDSLGAGYAKRLLNSNCI